VFIIETCGKIYAPNPEKNLLLETWMHACQPNHFQFVWILITHRWFYLWHAYSTSNHTCNYSDHISGYPNYSFIYPYFTTKNYILEEFPKRSHVFYYFYDMVLIHSNKQKMVLVHSINNILFDATYLSIKF
jgi:hypothetical protein